MTPPQRPRGAQARRGGGTSRAEEAGPDGAAHGGAGHDGIAGAGLAQGPPALVIEDRRVARIRRPVDLLQLVADGVGVALLVAVGLLAKASVSGVDTDVVKASQRLHPIIGTLHVLAVLALVLLPVALAVRQLVRREPRRLAEAVATGLGTGLLVGLANLVLRSSVAEPLYRAIAPAAANPSFAPLDAPLAGLIAYTTIIDLRARPRWRNALWLAVALYVAASLAALHTTVLSVLITLLLGRVAGLAVRYAAGSMSQRPSAAAIAAALDGAGHPLAELRRRPEYGAESRRYAAVQRDGERLDVAVFDRDQQAADALYRLYRTLRLREQVTRRSPLSIDRAAERRMLMAYAVTDAGVLTPQVRALVRAGPEALVLATEADGGTSLAALGDRLTDQQLTVVWDAVLRLHAHRITHRTLTADRIVIDGGGRVRLLDPGGGDVAASELQRRLDLAQLLAESATLVGPERAAALAGRTLGPAGLLALAPLLQPVVLARSTRAYLRTHKDVLPALRQRLLAGAPADGAELPPVQLARVRPRTLVTLVATIIAAYLLLGQLARVNVGSLLRSADPIWMVAAAGLSVLTYLAAAWSLSGFVLERLSFRRTVLAQLAGSFVTLVTPAAVGGAALNVRYLQRNKVPAAAAAASVGVAQLVAFVLHAVLLVVFVAITGARSHSLSPPRWVYFVIAALVVVALVVVAVPRGRRALRARLAPALGQVLPRLLELAQRPGKLAEGAGGALLLTVSYILCLVACVLALGGSIAFTSAAVVYLTGSALGSAVPTPGGLGAVEAALAAGLTATGMAAATAVSAVLLFRLLTFWLPVPIGWAAFGYLQRRHAL
jgi:glycosyltransferase 2 family protein